MRPDLPLNLGPSRGGTTRFAVTHDPEPGRVLTTLNSQPLAAPERLQRHTQQAVGPRR
jgi:hypothetical protein